MINECVVEEGGIAEQPEIYYVTFQPYWVYYLP